MSNTSNAESCYQANYSYNQFNQYHQQIFVAGTEFRNKEIDLSSGKSLLQIPSLTDSDSSMDEENKLGLASSEKTENDEE